jgi:hypothetical protein
MLIEKDEMIRDEGRPSHARVNRLKNMLLFRRQIRIQNSESTFY